LGSLWFGDFRCKQLKRWLKSYQAGDKQFIIEDNAELSWLNSIITNELYKNSLTGTNVIILLGINDCINSCTWDTISLRQIASDYCDSINELITQFDSLNFYFCSVNPVDRAYPGTNAKGDLIEPATLNKAIETFNSIIKSNCKATYIDSYTYLVTTKFNTRDGVRYTQATCESLLSYLDSTLKIGYGGVFAPRLLPPEVNNSSEGDGDLIVAGAYWISSEEAYRGLNPYPVNNKYAKFDGDTLPSSTAWAWGRFYEILGTEPKFKYGNAETWYSYTQDGYRRSQEPALGAVMCWQYGAGASADDEITDLGGHVAVVEQINEDGSIITSESKLNSSNYWWITKRTRNGRYEQTPDNDNELTFIETGDNTWGYSKASGYQFQGFILCPATVYIDKQEVQGSADTYLAEEQLKKNAQYIWQYFGGLGWTMNATAALLGNMEEESGLNHWRWESWCKGSIIDPETGKHHLNTTALAQYAANHSQNRWPGYGLVQWTSAGYPHKYIHSWCEDPIKNGFGKKLDYWDIDSQLARINWEAENGVQWSLASYNKDFKYLNESFVNLSFRDFISSTKDPGWLAAAFAFCYERPGSSDNKLSDREIEDGYKNVQEVKLALCNRRAESAYKWYTFLAGLIPQVSGAMFQATDIKITKHTDTSVEVSFFASKLKTAKYKLNTSGYKNIEITNRLTNSAYASFIVDNLTPGNTYELTVDLMSTDGKTVSKTAIFSMPQSLPESFEKVTLTKKDAKTPGELFKITTVPVKPSFGYWKSGSNFGYALQLVVNGQVKEEINLSELPDTVNIGKLFQQNVKVGDTIQIGIRNWVKYKGKKLYDSDHAKMSNPIAMLAQSVTMFLNVD
jgi:surface antigen